MLPEMFKNSDTVVNTLSLEQHARTTPGPMQILHHAHQSGAGSR